MKKFISYTYCPEADGSVRLIEVIDTGDTVESHTFCRLAAGEEANLFLDNVENVWDTRPDVADYLIESLIRDYLVQ